MYVYLYKYIYLYLYLFAYKYMNVYFQFEFLTFTFQNSDKTTKFGRSIVKRQIETNLKHMQATRKFQTQQMH